MNRKSTVATLNFLALIGIIVIIVTAFILQFTDGKLPCPLCMMQRAALLLAGFGFILNYRFGFKPSHYGVCLLGVLLMMSIGSRQVLLHILPGDTGYGNPFLGIHLYTWIVTLGGFGIFYLAIMLLCQRELGTFYYSEVSPTLDKITRIACYGVFVLMLLNALNTFLICGAKECPSDPVKYLLISS